MSKRVITERNAEQIFRVFLSLILNFLNEEDLPPKTLEVLRQRYYEGKNFKEAGQKLGVSEAYAIQLHEKAMRRLSCLPFWRNLDKPVKKEPGEEEVKAKEVGPVARLVIEATCPDHRSKLVRLIGTAKRRCQYCNYKLPETEAINVERQAVKRVFHALKELPSPRYLIVAASSRDIKEFET